MKTHRLFFAGILSVALLTPNACSKDDTTLANTPLPQETTATGETAGTLTVKFDYTHIDLGKLQPVIFDSSNNTYRVVGEKVGQAWGSGKAIQEREVK